MSLPYVKICGVTSVGDAEMCVAAGAHAIGLNFWPGSKRRCEEHVAGEIVRALARRAIVIGVFVDASRAEIDRIRAATGVRWAQLHGHEDDAFAATLPRSFKAVRVRGHEDIERARNAPGPVVLLDAGVPGLIGGTGTTFDWSLARGLDRRIVLAGGLDASNVTAAIAAVSPFAIDVASGVESSPGVKDPVKVRAFLVASGLAARRD